jgi:hypothetical protein
MSPPDDDPASGVDDPMSRRPSIGPTITAAATVGSRILGAPVAAIGEGAMSERVFERANHHHGLSAHWCFVRRVLVHLSRDSLVHQ